MLGRKTSNRRKAIGTAVIVGVVVVLIVAAAAAYFFILSSSPGQSSSSSTSRSSSSSTSTSVRVVKVTIPTGVGANQSLNFSPATITVVVGVNNTILWTNQDPIPHTVTSSSVPSGAASFDSSTINQGQTYQVTLTVPGTYKYICTIHPGWMVAQIIVLSR